MSAANDILTAVKTIVETEFPGKVCHLRRNSEKNPVYAADMVPPCFAASCNDDRPTEMAWAGKKFVKYVVTLEYITTELPGDRGASQEIEDVVSAASKLFLVPRKTNGKPGLNGVPDFNDCNVTPRKPYSLPYGSQTICASPLRLTFETIEDT